MSCQEEERRDGRLFVCGSEAVEGLPHCHRHARERLALCRAAEAEALRRLKKRAVELIDFELTLDAAKRDQQHDRQLVLSKREQIERYERALRAAPAEPEAARTEAEPEP